MALDYSSPERYLASGGTLTNGQIPSQQITSSGEMKPISVAGMNEPATPVSVPPQPIPSNYNAITGSTAASFSDILAGLNKQTETKTSELKTSEDRQLSLLQKLGLKPQAQGTEEDIQAQKLGYENLAQAQTRLTGINRQLQALSLESKAAQLAVEGQGRGITQGQIQLQQKDIERQNSIKSLGLSAQGLIIQGDIEGAQNAASRAIDLQFEQPEAELKFLQTTYEFSKNELDRVDAKRSEALGIALQERTRLLEEEKADKEAIMNMALATMQLYPNDPQAQYAAQQAVKEKDMGKAFELIGAYQSDPEALADRIADRQLKKAQTAKLYAEADSASTIRKISSIPFTYGTDEYYTELLRTSSGGKDLTGEQTLPLTKAQIVLNQIGELSGQIQNTTTDPILGFLRDNNPYDVKARLIQSTLRATVPNLARGIYGEVGVLTDNDIANYIQTLPNIRTTKQANDLILGMTLRTVLNSYRGYLETYANSGRDVSGFLPQYNAMREKIKGIEQSLGVGGVLPQDAKSTIYDSVIGQGQTEETSDTGYFGKFGETLKGLFWGN